jgi:hypothetical protein
MIIGWDIGIKNLAYAGLSKGAIVDTPEDVFKLGDDLEFTISIWNTINITQQVTANNLDDGSIVLADQPKRVCDIPIERKSKKGIMSPCGKKSSHLTADNRGLCGNHLGRDVEVEEYPITITPKCYYTVLERDGSSKQCGKKVVKVERDHIYKGYCKKHTASIQTENPDIELLVLGRKLRAQHISLTKLGIALYQELDVRPELLANLDVVLLENQPVLKNPTMKSMQMFLYSYFLMRCIIQRPEAPLGDIKCYMASNKTKLLVKLPDAEQERIKGELEGVKESYQINKKTSVAIVRYLLAQNTSSKWSDFFESHNKKDDLADALLMTIHYLL